MGVSGHICLYVACYDFVLGFNVSSLVLMIFQVGFWGLFHANFLFIIWFKMRGIIVEVDRFSPTSLKPVAGRFLVFNLIFICFVRVPRRDFVDFH